MRREELQGLVDRFVKAWTAEDLDGLLELYDPQAELTSPLLHTVRGVDGIEKAHQDLFMAFTQVSTDVHDVIIDTETSTAVLVFTIHATHNGDFHGHPGSGRRTANQSAFVFQCRDGKIVAERRLYDFTGFLMQLGFLKAKGA